MKVMTVYITFILIEKALLLLVIGKEHGHLHSWVTANSSVIALWILHVTHGLDF